MGSPHIGGVFGDLVATGAIKSARPVYGRTAQALGMQMGTILGYRGMRLAPKNFELSQLTDDGLGASMRSDWYVPIALSPLGAYLWLGIWLYAEEATAAPAVAISAQTMGGAVIDAGYTISAANGHLPVTSQAAGTVGATFIPTAAATVDRDRFWSSPWRETGSGPRLLDVSGYEGTDILVRLQTTSTRIYQVQPMEAYRERAG